MYGMSCPCLHTTPCNERCTCVDPVSSVGCRRCCSYGSLEQQKAMAEHLARMVDAAPELLAALQAITPHAWGHSKPGCKGKARDPENCEVCKAIWAARDAIAKATGATKEE